MVIIENLQNTCIELMILFSSLSIIPIGIIIYLCMKLFANKLFLPETKHEFRIMIGFICIMLCVFAFCLVGFFSAWEDYRMVKRGEYMIITGTVVDYKKSVQDNSGKSVYSWPVFADEETGRKVVINVAQTELQRTYTVYYLKNCRFGVIAEEQ